MANHAHALSQMGSASTPDCAVVELRDYSLLPGQRDVLVALFERFFIEGQEAAGITVLDHFRDLDDPDRFVWLRGFAGMPARARALDAFYTGPDWLPRRDAANATLVDSDNVLLLRPAWPGSGVLASGSRPPVGTIEVPDHVVISTVCAIDPAHESEVMTAFRDGVAPCLKDASATILATYVTEPSPNTYPRLPVREGEHVLVWLMRFPDLAAWERHRATLARSPRWADHIEPRFAHLLQGPPEVRRLAPTARSPWHR